MHNARLYIDFRSLLLLVCIVCGAKLLAQKSDLDFYKTIKEIAEMLFISSHTVISHRKSMREKLQVKNTAGLIRRSFELGYLRIIQQRPQVLSVQEIINYTK